MDKLLHQALCELHKAGHELVAPTVPWTPLPRFRTFVLAPGVTWPGEGAWFEGMSMEERVGHVVLRDGPFERYCPLPRYGVEYNTCPGAVRVLLRTTRGQPRLVLRALRRIEAATAWCRARRAGRERMAADILRQQARAVVELETRAALQALAQ